MPTKQRTCAQCQPPTEHRAGKMRNEYRNHLPKTFRKLNPLFMHPVAGSTLSPTAHIHVKCCGQRFPPYTETQSTDLFLFRVLKDPMWAQGSFLSIFSAGCSDPLVPKICISSIGHASKAFSRASSVELSCILISWHQWTESFYMCCAAVPQLCHAYSVTTVCVIN